MHNSSTLEKKYQSEPSDWSPPPGPPWASIVQRVASLRLPLRRGQLATRPHLRHALKQIQHDGMQKLAYFWEVPPNLPPTMALEWRLIAIRWVGIGLIALGFLFLPPIQQIYKVYVILAVATLYNLIVWRTMCRHPGILANGYVTTICDALLTIGMIQVLGGFSSPYYHLLYTVTISVAMRYSYGPAVSMVSIFIASDLAESIAFGQPIAAPFVTRSAFLLITALLASHLSAQARAEAALEERLHQAQILNRELEAFSYSVSHDLRSPLRSIDGFSQALLEDYGEQLDEIGQDYLRRVRAATQRMGYLIDDLLELSRVTRADVRKERVNLSSLANTIAATLQSQEPERSVEWVIQPALTAYGDIRLLQVVLENLLGNAWKFTRHVNHAKIEFGLTTHQGELVYFIRDNGAGFDMAYIDKLFHPFQRLHADDEFEGTGIGLATVQRVISRHGGRIWAEGVPGKGATFYFTLSAS